jgi:hypothetical protein
VPTKTNTARRLDRLGIHDELREYEVDPNDLAAETVAAKIGLPPAQVFKNLVARGERNGIATAVIPGNQELNLKTSQPLPTKEKFSWSPSGTCRLSPDSFEEESSPSPPNATSPYLSMRPSNGSK